MSVQVEVIPCAGTVPLTLPELEYPYIEASEGAGELVEPDNTEPAGPQFLADHEGTPLDMVVPPTTDPNSSTWLTDFANQVVITTPES